MFSKKVTKTVDNYTLEEMQYINQDGSEVWLVTHKLSKKRYTMKKVGISGLETQQTTSKPSISNKEELTYGKLLRQANILKSLNGESSPKCHRIIKTTNNYYLIYDMFPQISLQVFLDRQKPTNSQKLQILLNIARQLSIFHQKGVALLNLNINSIHVSGKDKIFINDWGMARNIDDEDIPSESSSRIRQFFAPELRKGNYSFSSDIYSLGKLINRMINRGELEDLPQKKKLKELVAKMTHISPNLRPTIGSVLSFLQESSQIESGKYPSCAIQNYKFSSEKHLTQKSFDSTQSGDHSQVSSNLVFLTKRNILQKKSQVKLINNGELSKNSSKPELFQKKLGKEGFNFTSQTNLQRKSLNVSPEGQENSYIQFAKSICRRRSLVFFILSLAQFVMESSIVPELAYILTKHARLSVFSIMKDVEAKMQSENLEEFKHISGLLKKEYSSIAASQLNMKKKFVYKNLQTAVKCEFINDKTINDPLLHNKILEFTKSMIKICDEQIMDGNESFDVEENLRQIWFVLKKIEFGSYESYWKEEQLFFKDYNTKRPEKMTPRDILEKIKEILKNNPL